MDLVFLFSVSEVATYDRSETEEGRRINDSSFFYAVLRGISGKKGRQDTFSMEPSEVH